MKSVASQCLCDLIDTAFRKPDPLFSPQVYNNSVLEKNSLLQTHFRCQIIYSLGGVYYNYTYCISQGPSGKQNQ